MRILIATTNAAKTDRYRKYLAGLAELLTPVEAGLEATDIEEGNDPQENATRKALAYRDRTDLPVIGTDSAFVIPGVGLDPARVKRNALGGRREADLTQEEIARRMISFYQDLVRRYGGRLPAHWEEVFALVLPDGSVRVERSVRAVTLVDEVRGEVNPYLPIRSLYVVEATGKFVCEQTEEDEAMEMRPVRAALERLVKIG